MIRIRDPVPFCPWIRDGKNRVRDKQFRSANTEISTLLRIFHVQNSARCDGAVYAGPGRLGVPAAIARHPAGVRAHPGGGGGGAAAHLALLLLCRAVRAAGTLAPRRLHLLRLQAEHRHLPSGGLRIRIRIQIRTQEGKNDPQTQCFGSMTFGCGSGSAEDPCL
jgi:hypothetical protein